MDNERWINYILAKLKEKAINKKKKKIKKKNLKSVKNSSIYKDILKSFPQMQNLLMLN